MFFEPDNIRWATVVFSASLVWIVCVSCIKLSILFAFRDLFDCIVWFVRCVHAMMFVCVLVLIGLIVGLCLRCTPIMFIYNHAVRGHCIFSDTDAYYSIGGVSLVTDFLVLIMPLPVVWKLRISPLKKLGISAMFGLGAMSERILLLLYTR
jgi:hypothetical protein